MEDTSLFGFIDDVAFITAYKSLNRIRRHLQILANQELQWGKQHEAAFNQKESMDAPDPPPAPGTTPGA